ncbi:aldo/keto reductase [Sphingomonas sp. LR55]
MFGAWGHSDETEARRMVDICLDAGVTLFDTADVYSNGASETVLGAAIKGRRDQVLVSTKTGLPMGDGPDDWGTSRAPDPCGRGVAATSRHRSRRSPSGPRL